MFLIETKRLKLCPFKAEDAEEYFSLVNSSNDIKEYVPYAIADTFEETQKRVASVSGVDFKNEFYVEVREKSSNRIIGAIIAFRLYGNKVLDASYFIGDSYRRNGYMQEALLGFINYLLTECEYCYNFLDFTIDSKNEASQRLIEKLGGNLMYDSCTKVLWRLGIDHFKLL